MSPDSKAVRRYQAGVERALGLFDATHEWADYIAFLSRLHKALYAHPEDDVDVPHKKIVAKHLSQCLNPSLPSGVHQKALEVYAFIFSLIGVRGLTRDLPLYLPGFAHTLAFASLSIRPLFLSLIDDHVLKLSSSTLRPALKALLLSLLPGLEEDTSEDFEATLASVNKIRQIFRNDLAEGFFWQSLFLASITNAYRRSGVLVYLAKYLPKFAPSLSSSAGQQNGDGGLNFDYSTFLSPEPGLLIRCFATALQDEQTLIQRGFLDLLVTHLPLNASIFQREVLPDDLDILVTAAMTVVLRRDMSLNRRLWTWFLGPETNAAGGTNGVPVSPESTGQQEFVANPKSDQEENSSYMHHYGLPPLIRCFQKTISKNPTSAGERARPFRIGLSLMDRWEIGGPVVLSAFIPLLRSLYSYQQIAKSPEEYDELFRSANVFFDGVESHLIWSQIFELINSRDFDLVEFILSKFNLQEEEMLVLHMPMIAVALSGIMSNEEDASTDHASHIVKILLALVSIIPPRAFDKRKEAFGAELAIQHEAEPYQKVKQYYSSLTPNLRLEKKPFTADQCGRLLLENLSTLFMTCLEKRSPVLPEVTQILSLIINHTSDHEGIQHVRLMHKLLQYLELHGNWSAALPYSAVSPIIPVLTSITGQDSQHVLLSEQELLTMIPLIMQQLWPFLSPQTPQYHVEVSQSLWDLHKASKNYHGVESALMTLMISSESSGFQLSETTLNRFAVLWNHIGTTVKAQSLDDALTLLKQPLLVTIDSLDYQGKEWLQSLPSIKPLYHAVMQDMQVTSDESLIHLRRVQNVMKVQSKDQWHQFALVDEESQESFAVKILRVCSQVIASEESELNVEQVALAIIRMIYAQSLSSTGPTEGKLFDLLITKLGQIKTPVEMQAALLETLTAVLGQRRPNAGVLACLLKGISSTRPAFVDKWISTLCLVIPSYGDSVFQIVIKVTEELCSRIESSFGTLSSTYAGSKSTEPLTIETRNSSLECVKSVTETDSNLEKVIFNLFAGLEYILARAHERLTDRESEVSVSKSPDLQQGIFGSIIAGSQPAIETNQLRGSLMNDRLTIVLCFQDFIKICVKIWSWGSSLQTAAIESRASFLYMSSKMRVRARRLLENLLEAEPQECLETIIELWVKAAKSAVPQDHELVLRLLQTLNGARPRIMMPATFNAIYNRTNPAALDKNQKSTMSTELSALELLSFLIEYTKALEDDLLDEIWVDCTTFLREVLGNPMPHRQILLRLLEFVAVLCSKMENTNFGEESKMRRELGDLCIRLFTAIFTVKPGGEDATPPSALTKTSQKDHPYIPPYLGPGNSTQTLCKTLPTLSPVLADSDRMTNAVSGIILNITGPILRSKAAFQNSATPNFFSLLQLMSKSSGASKLWKRDILETFNDARFFQTPTSAAKDWLPIIRHLSTTEKQLITEMLTRLTAPTTAGLMFGVGASAARIEADRRAQLNLRRIAILILANDIDSFTSNFRQIAMKVEELLTATSSSSPSSTTRMDVYMLVRALVLKTSPVHLSPLWPMIDAELRAVFAAIFEGEDKTYSATARLQAAKLLDLLLLLKPDEFQLHEWLYVTDTVDAIYPPNGWASMALVDRMGQEKSDLVDDGLPSIAASTTRKPWLCSEATRKTAVEDIDVALLQPFFSHLSIHAFEDVYGLRQIDLEACEMDLLADVFEI